MRITSEESERQKTRNRELSLGLLRPSLLDVLIGKHWKYLPRAIGYKLP